jgi:solute carrier family 12 (potassium/chloride transporters), member 9
MPPAARPPINKQASNFQTRTATDEREELSRRYSTLPDQESSPSSPKRRLILEDARALKPPNPYDPATNHTAPLPRRHSFTRRLLHLHDGANDFEPPSLVRKRSVSGHRKSFPINNGEEQPLAPPTHNGTDHKKQDTDTAIPKPGLGPRPVGGHGKLGTFSGVFVPTCLNVLSILMFLRFGFILGQGGVLGMMGQSRAQYIMS